MSMTHMIKSVKPLTKLFARDMIIKRSTENDPVFLFLKYIQFTIEKNQVLTRRLNGEVGSPGCWAVGGGVGQSAAIDVRGGVLSDSGTRNHVLGHGHWRGQLVGDCGRQVYVYKR